MTEKETVKDVDLEGELKLYELGFHILPTVAEEGLGAEVSSIKEVIEKNGGIFVGEEGFPKHMALAYPISKKIDNKNVVFDSAYFGWVKFEVTAKGQLEIEKNLGILGNILRFLLIKSVRESSMITVGRPQKSVSSKKDIKTKGDGPKEEISEKEVDEAIEELVVE